MEIEGLVEQFLNEQVAPQLLSTPLPDETATVVVERLKQEADRFWFIDPNCSLQYADRIISIGRARNDKSQLALGFMARGDALKFLGNLQEAWEMLEQSGNMYKSANDEVGWARTRIGRLALGPDLNRVPETLADVERARAIFHERGEQEKLMRLEINTAHIYDSLGDLHQALQLYYSALSIAGALGTSGELHLGMLYMNIGYVHECFGDFPQALLYYQKARSHYLARNEIRNIIYIENNIACIAQAQGHYRSALRLLNDILARGSGQFPREYERVRHSLAECYLNLNRYSEARDLARQVLESYRSFNDTYYCARALLHLATAESELGNFPVVRSALDEAASIFTALGALSWGMMARLWHGQVAFKQGDYELAWSEARAAADCFEAQGQQVNYATACILMGQVALKRGDLDPARLYGAHALQVAQHYNVPSLRYAAHLLLGRVAKDASLLERASRNFRAATATIERIQRGLTITLRSSFLENKGEAWRELIGLYLHLNQTNYAFDAVERAKTQVLVNYLNNREQFHWSREESESRALIDEFERLRAEHQSFYHLMLNPPREQDSPNAALSDEVRHEVAVREKRMRAITEKLYLLSYSDNITDSSSSSLLPEIQASIGEETLLVEFYDDGAQFWAFVLDGQSCDVRPLPIRAETLNLLLNQLKSNISAVLNLNSDSLGIKPLTILAQRLLKRLYTILLEPLELQRRGRERITIVPYGVLHYLPFHLLYDGANYLIENYEVVTLPSASLVTRSAPHRSPGTLIVSHSWNGRLPYTQTEAQIVHNLFGGTLYAEESAIRAVLKAEPAQILHIATHGQYRLDQPDLSFLELADGQLYADDLLQQDLSYELITLSACETGQANVAADEELIGIGRGLLYAGAGALILSQWQVADTSTVIFMEQLYRGLRAGNSKAAALREAQLFFLKQDRQLHPALWGAFQLIGDAQPLSRLD
jgi:CHAT domain-containing protein/tetratricopeptide (TPR) repeat protein